VVEFAQKAVIIEL
jgi:hypothetical protein